MLANHCKFPPIADEKFLPGTWVSAAVNKIGSFQWKREFRRETRKFLEEFKNSVLSTVAARSNIGRRMSCFCPAIAIGGNDHSPFPLLGLLLDGFLEGGGSEAPRLRLARLSTSILSKSNDSWSVLQRGTAPT